MSRPIFVIILSLIRLAIKVISRGSRILLTVLDIVDDGVQNGSVTTPEWFERVRAIVDYLDGAVISLGEFPQAYSGDDHETAGE